MPGITNVPIKNPKITLLYLKSKNTKVIDLEMAQYLKEIYKDVFLKDNINNIFEINNFRDVLYNKLEKHLVKIH